MRFSVSYILIMFLTSFSIFASDLDELKFEHLGAEQGMRITEGFSAIKCSHGFMWLATDNGLFRYDGIDFKQFKYSPSDSTTISDNFLVSIMFEDTDGYLWIGTGANGVNKFDCLTEKFVRYKHNPIDPKSISHNHIFRIYQDKNGDIWLATFGGGINKFNKEDNTFSNYKIYPNFPNNISDCVMSIYEDKEGVFWLGTLDGVYQFDRKTEIFTNFNPPFKDPDKFLHTAVIDIIEEDNGNYWFGTQNGLFKYITSTKKLFLYEHSYNNSSSLSNNTIRQVIEDKNDNAKLWVSTNNGLNEFNKNTGEFIRYYHDPQNKNSLGLNALWGIYQDECGILWIGRHDGGFDKLNLKKNIIDYHSIKKNESDKNGHSATTFFEDSKGNFWIGTFDGGLFQFNKEMNLLTNYSHDPLNNTSLSWNFVFCIYENANNQIWVGTYGGGGLNRLDLEKKIFKRYEMIPPEGNLKFNFIKDIIEDSFGEIWIGSAGLYNLNEETDSLIHFKRYRNDPLSFNEIHTIFEDSEKSLWVGTVGAGLFCLPVENRINSDFIQYMHNAQQASSISNNLILSICEDYKGNIWIGTINGLNKFSKQDKKFTRYDIPADQIINIQNDDRGYLWLSTEKGLIEFNPNEEERKNCKFYNVKDGLPFNDLYLWSSYKASDGKIYYGGRRGQGKGFLSFHPDSLEKNTVLPKIVITDIKINNKEVLLDSSISFKKRIQLSYEEDFLIIKYASLDFADPFNNQYAYIMEGIDEKWIYCGNNKQVSYAHIQPGVYTFRVKGSNNDGIWNEEGTSIKIIITPPWWQTNYAYAFYILLFLAGLITWKNYERDKQKLKAEQQIQKEKEKAQLKETELRAVAAELQAKAADHQARTIAAQTEVEKEQMRSRIASDLHDEIGSNLSSIALISQTLQKKLKPALKEKKHLQNIHHIARMTADSMRDIIWFINPENDDLLRLIIKMRESTNLMLGNINFTFNSNDTEFSFEPDLNFKRNLFLIYKEILQNIIKHSQTKKVDITISQSEKRFILQVLDNGIGFDTSKNTDGNGLKNIENRARQIDCNLEIDTIVGKGTSIKLLAKIP